MAEVGPSVDEMEYGYDSAKLGDYLDNTIKAKVFTEMQQVLQTGFNDINTVCEAEWSGVAKNNFISNLNKDCDQFMAACEALYQNLVNELSAVQGSMKANDAGMIELDG